MAMNIDSGYFDPSLTSAGGGYADLISGTFDTDDRFEAADLDYDQNTLVNEWDEHDDLQELITLGLHMSD